MPMYEPNTAGKFIYICIYVCVCVRVYVRIVRLEIKELMSFNGIERSGSSIMC